MESLEKAHLVIEALQSKKAQDIVVLDLRGVTIIADFFVIATGSSLIHSRALIEGVLEEMRKHDIKSVRAEGMSEASWVLVDLGDVVVHVFDAEHRDFYQLERLWSDAARLPVPAEEVG